MRVVITKSTQTLVVRDGDRELLRVAVALGKNPADKVCEGDLATPEGEFYICYRNPESRYHRFLGISYPNTEDAARGLRTALITAAEHEAICAAIARRECPPWKTALGGEIGLHGPCPNRTWTHGCVAMSVPAIEELDRLLGPGDPVTIVP